MPRYAQIFLEQFRQVYLTSTAHHYHRKIFVQSDLESYQPSEFINTTKITYSSHLNRVLEVKITYEAVNSSSHFTAPVTLKSRTNLEKNHIRTIDEFRIILYNNTNINTKIENATLKGEWTKRLFVDIEGAYYSTPFQNFCDLPENMVSMNL